VLRTITAPLAAGGVLAGAALVFLTAVKELPATLILAPIGFETLSTEIWSATSVAFYERGAIPSLVLLLISAPALYLLTTRQRP
jgi:iron(III) transport system permease protein